MTEDSRENTKASKTKSMTVIQQQHSVIWNKIQSLDVGVKQYPEWCVMLKPEKPKDDNFEASVLYLEQLELYKQANSIKEEIDRKLIVPGVVRVTAIREFRTTEPKE